MPNKLSTEFTYSIYNLKKCYISDAHSLGKGLGTSGGGPSGLSLEQPGIVNNAIKNYLTIIYIIINYLHML